MAYLDLDEMAAVCDRSRFWSCEGPAPFWIRREDYFGDPELPLKMVVINKVKETLGFLPTGPVHMLTNPRCFGLRMNPITVYYVFDPSGQALQAVLAEVTNTPWDRRHVYVLDYRDQAINASITFAKSLHVSPFMPMQQHYRWRCNLPAESLRILLQSYALGAPQLEEVGSRKCFEALLDLRREACSARVLNRLLWRFPWMTAKVLGGIYWQAIKLWCKGARFYRYVAPCESLFENAVEKPIDRVD
jgi:uncharacterized protein